MSLFIRKSKTFLICIVMAFVVASTSVLTGGITVQAETIKTGTIVLSSDSSTLNFRSGPGTEYSKIGTLSHGDTGEILDEALSTAGVLWYKMVVGQLTGWVHSGYVTVKETTETLDPDFQKYLEEQGFPESYHSALQALHVKYPNWVFEAQHTNLNWNTVIEKESVYALNTVQNTSSPSSWKSTEPGAYSWITGQWSEVDSGNWVAASSEIIAYYMDPRNFLDSTYVFQFLEQSYDASTVDEAQVKAELSSLVKNTFLAGEYTEEETTYIYVDVILSAAASAGVSPHMLASMILQEQGLKGTGKSISGTVEGYEGYYNFYNIGAYKTAGMSAVQRGLWYASGGSNNGTSYNRPWDSREKSIAGGAQYFYEKFIKKGQDTLYLKKFNVQGNNPYSNQYMTNVGGAASEAAHMASAYDAEARTAELVFKIPVYKNMPDEPAEKPTKDGSPNYMLKSLTVGEHSLTPAFDMYETSYAVTVGNEATVVDVTAVAYDDKAVITGTGNQNLSVGENLAEVLVTAENGDSRLYSVVITRSAEVGTPPEGGDSEVTPPEGEDPEGEMPEITPPEETVPEFTKTRIYGRNRYGTAFAIADALKETMDVDSFETVVIASGTDFPDALSGSYLAAVKNAPILITNGSNISDLQQYVKENVPVGNTIYILGGTAAVSEKVDQAMNATGYKVKRLYGKNRYETNLKILEEAGVGCEDILVCTGTGFADSLSASATKLPILLVGDTLTETQNAFLKKASGDIYIIGGDGAVGTAIEMSIGGCTRLSGKTRYETSVLIGKTFFEKPTGVVLAYAQDFPDGLCGGPFACNIDAPLILAAEGNESAAKEYVDQLELSAGIILGGSKVLPEEVAELIFGR